MDGWRDGWDRIDGWIDRWIDKGQRQGTTVDKTCNFDIIIKYIIHLVNSVMLGVLE